MNLSNDLVNKFVEITNDETPNKEGSTAYGVTVQYGDRMYVKLDGSDLLTPVETTSAIKSGERVTVLIKDHNATVTGNLSDPSASSKDLTDIGDKIAEVDILIADKVDTEVLVAETARIEELIATKASIGQLEADRAEIEHLLANKAEITDLEAINADIEILDAEVADIETLVNGHLTSDNIQSLVLTSDKVTVDNAFIKDAMIDNVSANKITSGQINTSLVSISSEDGSMTLNGSTQQFKDSEGTVRIQIGKDTEGNFTFCLFSQDGVGILLDEEGIHAGAVPDGLIVNDMVADNANISGSKLDINSVITSINNGSTTIDSSRIYLDDESQSLKVAFDSLKTKVETIEETVVNGDLSNIMEQITSNTTNINVMQGQISSLISNTTITKENGQVVQLKDEYNSTKDTVDSHTTKIGLLETNVDGVSSKQTSMEQDLDGFKTIVSNSYATKDEVEVFTQNVFTNTVNGISQRITKIEGDYVSQNTLNSTVDGIEIEISKTGVAQLIPNGAMQSGQKFWYSWNSNLVYEINPTTGTKTIHVTPSFSDEGAFGVQLPACDLQAGKTYTVSFWVESNNINTLNYNFLMNSSVGYERIGNVNFETNNGILTRVGLTFEAPYDRNTCIMLGFEGDNVQDKYFRIHEACCYEGTKMYPYKPSPNEIYNGKTYFDMEGMGVRHDDGSEFKVTPEELRFTDIQARKKMAIKKGSLYTYDANNGDLLGMFSSNKVTGNYRGVTTGIAGSSHYYAIGVTQELSDDDQLNMTPYILIAQEDLYNFLGNNRISAGINFMNTNTIFHKPAVFYASPIISGGFVLADNDEHTNIYIQGNTTYLESNLNLITGGNFYGGGLYGRDVTSIGYTLNGTYTDVIKLYASIEQIDFLRPLNMNGFGIFNSYFANVVSAVSPYARELSSSSTTDNITHSSMSFTDGELRYVCRKTCHTVEEWDYNDEGVWSPLGVYYCYCELPIFMAENIENDYHVNIGKIGWGDYRVIEKNPYLFIVESQEEGFAFTWEIVAKQIEVPKTIQ